MIASGNPCDLELSRRKLLAAVGITVVAASLIGTGEAESALAVSGRFDPEASPPVHGLHLQFGADASSEMVVSWHTLQSVRRPRVLVGRLDGKLERVADAQEISYTDAKSGQRVYAYHARLGGLQPGSAYLYAALHDGAEPEFGTFRTAPRGRAPFAFTSFGDQGTPTLGKRYVPPPGVTIPKPPYVNDNLGSPAGSDTTLGVERLRPLFHLFNGDLCYANLAEDRVRAWWDFWTNNSRSARNRPWMPSPGNHENELGNGPIGYRAYQTYFGLPAADGQTDVTRGLWYAFTAGSIRVISIANDDVTYQDGGNSYVRGYSAGAQKAWLERELAATRDDHDVDWVVVCMHQVAISTVDMFNGADLGIRQEWLPLFDKYGVDLVVCGHEHHYERSHPIRGQQANATLTPIPAATATDLIDTTKGTVHMVIGGGGTSLPSNQLFFSPPACRVITAVGAPDAAIGKRPPIYVKEDAPWSAMRNAAHSYGFAAFSLDPGSRLAATPRSRSHITTWSPATGDWRRLKRFRCAVRAAIGHEQRSALVGPNSRTMSRRFNFCGMLVNSLTMTSGRLRATAFATDFASSASPTTASMPRAAKRRAPAGLRVKTVGAWPALRNWSTSGLPTAPVPPAMKTRIDKPPN